MLHRAAQLGLVFCLGLVILAWGTSPCLFASMLSSGGTCGAEVEDCGCGCCCEGDTGSTESGPPETPKSGTDECPICSSVGNMHQLLPVGAKIVLDAPAITALVLPVVTATPIEAQPRDAASSEILLEPPRVHFCTTVALLR